MSLRKLPEAKAFSRPQNYSGDAPSEAVKSWLELPKLAEADEPNTISIYDVIGEDPFMGGFSVKRMGAALRSIGANAVTVNINSPGGDYFDGVAIYNLLREHPAEVTVKVMGVAASAASVIAMAGDRIVMGAGTTMMIHNAWGVVIGDKNDFQDAFDTFARFDESMAGIYAARTGVDQKKIAKMMSDETFMSAQEAVDFGFADIVANMPIPAKAEASHSAREKFDFYLAKANVPRSERRRMLRELTGMQDAAGTDKPGAVDFPAAELEQLLATLTEKRN